VQDDATQHDTLQHSTTRRNAAHHIALRRRYPDTLIAGSVIDFSTARKEQRVVRTVATFSAHSQSCNVAYQISLGAARMRTDWHGSRTDGADTRPSAEA
jgi:hypothetical protein